MTDATTCEWSENSDGQWETSCDNMFEFNEGGPILNGFKFCPYCGVAMQAIYFMEESFVEDTEE